MEESTARGAPTPVRAFARLWTESGRQFWRGLTAANRVLLPLHDDDRETAPAEEPELAFTEVGWEAEATVEDRAAVGVGDAVRFSKRFTDEDVRTFARVSGDTNRLHLDERFAEGTRFGGRIVHGTLASGLISAALARLPGVTVYLSQDLEFLRPVEIDEAVTGVVEVVEELGDDRFRLSTVVENEEGEIVIDGEAVVMIDELPEDAA